jgi:actin-related protein 8
MVLRELQEELLRQQASTEKARHAGETSTDGVVADHMALDEPKTTDEAAEEEEVERYGSKIIVIHPGSQNLRLGFASDALPKSIPNVIAKKSDKAEFEIQERWPKRMKLDKDGDVNMDDAGEDENVGPVENLPDVSFDPLLFSGEVLTRRQFEPQINAMSAELKTKMRSNKRRMLPNSKDLVLTFNRRAVPDEIKEHNDPYRVEWTEVKDHPKEYYVGQEALRIQDTSTPRYRLFWPIRYGWFNEEDYRYKKRLLEDIQVIIEEGIKSELKLEKKDLVNYRAVLVVPDLYERNYVIDMVDMLMKEVCFAEVCIIQVSAVRCGAPRLEWYRQDETRNRSPHRLVQASRRHAL